MAKEMKSKKEVKKPKKMEKHMDAKADMMMMKKSIKKGCMKK